MRVRVGIENNNEGRSIAWALEHPGCFAYGLNEAEARLAIDPALQDYAAWVKAHGMSWMDAPERVVDFEETFDAYVISRDAALAQGKKEEYLVESFFQYDAEPLNGMDTERGLKMLNWSREDLLNTIKGLDPARLDQRYEGERWSINGILRHIGGAEWWYLDRLGSHFPEHEEDLPDEPMERLELVRAHLLAWLPKQEGAKRIIDHERETWSPRKVLRRALWHERDHTQHIRKLLPLSGIAA